MGKRTIIIKARILICIWSILVIGFAYVLANYYEPYEMTKVHFELICLASCLALLFTGIFWIMDWAGDKLNE